MCFFRGHLSHSRSFSVAAHDALNYYPNIVTVSLVYAPASAVVSVSVFFNAADATLDPATVSSASSSAYYTSIATAGSAADVSAAPTSLIVEYFPYPISQLLLSHNERMSKHPFSSFIMTLGMFPKNLI